MWLKVPGTLGKLASDFDRLYRNLLTTLSTEKNLNGKENVEIEPDCKNDDHIYVEERFRSWISFKRCDHGQPLVLFMSCFLCFFCSSLVAAEPRVQTLYFRFWWMP